MKPPNQALPEHQAGNPYLRNLHIFGLFLLAATVVMVWPILHFLELGGSFSETWTGPDQASPEMLQAYGFLVGGGLIAFVLLMFGISWTVLRAWKPFAATLGWVVGIHGVLIAIATEESEADWVTPLYAFTIPLGLLALGYSLFLSLRNNVLLVTVVRLLAGTLTAALVSLLFPLLIVGVAFYLKAKRGLTFREVWSESPHLYNFIVVNLYPVFFQILPGLNYVRRKGQEEKKKAKNHQAPVYESRIDLSRLQVGDVILTGSESWSIGVPIQASNILSASEADRFWYHATIYAGNGKIIEAQSDGRGVTETDLEEYYFRRGRKLRVLRHRYLDRAALANVVQFCRDREEEGCPYDNWGVSFYALAALIPPMMSGWLESPFADKFFNVSDSYFCSELIAEAFLVNGHDVFGRKPWRVKPLDFAFSPFFEEIDCDYQRWPVGDLQEMVGVDLASLRRHLAFDGVTMKVPNTVPEEVRSFAGQSIPLNTRKRRSVLCLTEEQALLFGLNVDNGVLAPGEVSEEPFDQRPLALANIYHNEQFWVGLVNPAQVQNTFMQQEVFLTLGSTDHTLAAHGQLRFLMLPGSGIELLPQEEGQSPYDGPPIHDFIISAEATGPDLEGYPDYDLVGGLKGWFRQSMRLISTVEKAEQMLGRDNEVHQFLLQLTPKESRNVLIEAIGRSHHIGLSQPYNTLAIGGTQCVYEAFNILDRAVINHRKPTVRLRFSRALDRIPIFIDTYLDLRGLRHEAPDLRDFPTLNEEMAMDAATREELRRRLMAVYEASSADLLIDQASATSHQAPPSDSRANPALQRAAEILMK
ncbi:MAG: hypothetical protein AAGJ31_02350 [Verrucomicrobiota bacterium]